jgi:hypothetical protein
MGTKLREKKNAKKLKYFTGDVLALVSGFPSKGEKREEFVKLVGQMLHRMLCGESAMSVLAQLNPSQELWLSPDEVSCYFFIYLLVLLNIITIILPLCVLVCCIRI